MPAVNPQVITAFASPIITAQLPNPEGLNAQLRQLFLAREAEGERYRKKIKTPTQQVNIFESEFNLFSWPDQPVQVLREFCLGTLSQTMVQLNDYSPEQIRALNSLKLLVDCWFHVTRFGGFISNHFHPMASWSGVYCVCSGETPPAYPESGQLCFPDPRPAARAYVDPGNVRLKGPFSSGSLSFSPKGGDLILFPSHMAHEVKPFFGRDERITVAFNCSFVRPEGEVFGF
ncbi:MAG: putative 2OG-Fe(II) oxygenase [Nevskia sp.]|nr:putative 2OG-Fe(II) oxygenase [Nevskia sp.]